MQESQGRLSGRLPPWEVLGVWPRGDFRVATSGVDGAFIAIAFSLLCGAVAAIWWLRRRQLAVPAVLAAAFVIFIVARVTSGIHVEAKALIVAAPLVMLFIVRGLLDGEAKGPSAWRIALGALFTGLAVISTLLALRATPVGTPAHVDELAELQDEVAGKEVAFLSLDRFAPYRLSGAERVQSPGGYVPNALRPRENKEWGQSEPIDFDSLDSDVLDRFGYAVTTGAAYGSSAPENWKPVARTENFVLWKRNGKAPAREVLAEDPAPGAVAGTESAICDAAGTKGGTVGFWLTDPVVADNDPWRPTGAIKAGESAHLDLLLPAGTWQVSLQYNSEVPLELKAGDLDPRAPGRPRRLLFERSRQGTLLARRRARHRGRHGRVRGDRRRGPGLEPAGEGRAPRLARRPRPRQGRRRGRARPPRPRRASRHGTHLGGLRTLRRLVHPGREMTAERPLVFVGGTGRSGTHVLADLLDRHSRFHSVPIECRFHVNPQGFPDLLEGRATKDAFLRKLKRFWWYRIRAGEPLAAILPKLPLGRQTRGLHKVVPREDFDAAVLGFEGAYDEAPEAACSDLFEEMLMPLADRAGKPGLVEMSCFTVAQAPTLARLFPHAKIVHTVRDGRDAGSSKVSKRQKREHPRDAREGVAWWRGRLAEAEAGARAVPADRLLTISLDELVGDEGEESYARLLEFLELEDEPAMREFFETEMTSENAHRDRWREGLSEPEQREVVDAYEEALETVESEGYLSAPLLRRVYERHG